MNHTYYPTYLASHNRLKSNVNSQKGIFQTIAYENSMKYDSMLFDETIIAFAFFGYLDNMFKMQNTLKVKQ